MAGKAHECDFFVRCVGSADTGDRGAIKGFDNEASAKEDAARRNERATEMGLKARYEVVG